MFSLNIFSKNALKMGKKKKNLKENCRLWVKSKICIEINHAKCLNSNFHDFSQYIFEQNESIVPSNKMIFFSKILSYVYQP